MHSRVWTLILVLFLGGAVTAQAPLESIRLTPGDEMSNEKKSLQAELLIRKSEDQALAQIKDLLRKHRGEALEVELLFRLAELHMRRAKTERFFEIHRHSDTVTKLAPQHVKKASQKREIQQAISTYDNIRRRFPKYQQMDLVLFNSGFARQLINDDRSAEKLYWEIIAQHPNSYLVPDAHLAIGEINFERRGYQKALEHFLKIEDYPASRAYSYGMYKASWAYYNLQRSVDAMKKLEQVVTYGQYVKDNNLDSRLDLRAEALKDLALFYSDVMKAKGAVAYFMKWSRELSAWPQVHMLTEIYKRHGKHEDIEVVLLDVINMIPDKSAVIAAYDELLMTHERALNRDKAVERLNLFVRYCKGLAPRGKMPAEEAVELFDSCKGKVVESSHHLASKWHGLWIKNNKHELFQKSASLAYLAYLEFADPVTEEMAQVRFNYGELLFNGEEFRKASGSYALVRTAKPSQQLLHDGNYAAIVSLERATGDTWNDKDEQHFKKLVTSYLEDSPKGKYSLDLRFKVAFIAYQKGRYDEAMPQLKELGWAHKGTENGERAQDLYLDILNIKKRYGDLKQAAAEVGEMTRSSERKAKVKNIYQEAYFAEVQTSVEAGAGIQAAQSFLAFSKENPKSPLASKAWWNATQILFDAEEYKEGSQKCLEFAAAYPKDDQAKECLVQAALHFEKMGHLDQAAHALEMGAKLSQGAEAQKTLELAADFWALGGADSKADGLYDKLFSSSAAADQDRVLTKWHRLAQSRGMKARERLLRERVLALPKSAYKFELLAEQVESSFSKGDLPGAFRAASGIVGSSAAPSHLKAKARYFQARVLQDEFEKQSVKARPERLALVLGIKTEKLEKAQQAFQATISYRDSEYSLKALEGLAQIYLTYAQDMRTISAPQELSAQEQAQFRAELENLAIPMEEKGIEGVEQALRFAKDVKLRDDSAHRIQTWLDQLNHQPAGLDVRSFQPQPYLPRGGDA